MKGWIIFSAIVLTLTGLIYYWWWSSRVQEPLGFSHAQHLRQQIECSNCHSGTGEPYPSNERCAVCHQGMNVPADVRWVKVYRTAPDIIFDHPKHAAVNCSVCHEAMATPKRVVHETRFAMEFCVNCHKQQNADNQCATCHRNR